MSIRASLAVGAFVALALPAAADIRGTTETVAFFPIADIESRDLLGDPDNAVVVFDIAAAVGLPSGTSVTMTSIGWYQLLLEPLAPNWPSESQIYFDDALAPDLYGLFLTPGLGAPGPSPYYNSGGQIDLTDNAIPNIHLPDGRLRLEFNETFDNFPGAADAVWMEGSFGIGIAEIPAPAAGSLLALGVTAALRRGRRRLESPTQSDPSVTRRPGARSWPPPPSSSPPSEPPSASSSAA